MSSSILTDDERELLFQSCTDHVTPYRWLVVEFSGGNDSGGFDHIYLSPDTQYGEPREWWDEVKEIGLAPAVENLIERVMYDQIIGFDGPPDLMGRVVVDSKERGITVTWSTQEWKEQPGGEY